MSNAVHVVCPQCGQINRIPDDRLIDGPSCGGCKHGLFPGKPVELTSQNFARFIAKSDLPVVVDFWAPWCGPCKMMAPVFNQVAAELSPRVILAKVNTEAEQALAGQFGIRSIPTLAVFKGGKESTRMAGAMDAGNLKNWIAQNS
ncbi:MAG: thioredoxin TrxC [Gammaproteobacteria bacterium]|nr:thioredoxin TrxC [Gammaproteobacteria bacterium]